LIEAVSDEAILDAYKKLAKLEGIYAEPAGAAPLALTVKLKDQGLLDKDDVVVCVISGIGLKDTGVTLKMVGKPINIPVDVDEALKVLSYNRF
ncbi:MAG: pyridoxal-phosphate dependent enzyme, partial [archaeon GB-1867-097]|nr:pyridoxal-phosphate dependent enzyme [Candidatus Culexmicrobium thermophilum]